MIGIDAVAKTLAKASRRAAAKPSRGGLENAIFLCAAAEAVPGPLAGVADDITINYSWGSLLRALVMPEAESLTKLAALGRPEAQFAALINVQPLRDAAQAERLGLATAALLRDPDRLRVVYAQARFEGLCIRDATRDPLPDTSWAKHLAMSKREVWRLEANVSG